ncbi:MAG: hypothetical protein M3011_08090 [Actinomycetota bacterium]|nr:hypothetical protein [Actinomycetota bacterium]
MTTNELSQPESSLGDPGETTPPAGASRRRHLRIEAAWLLATMAVTGILVVLILQLWRASPRVPFAYASDANFTAVIVKGIAENGWYEPNPDLGAPVGYDLKDFPVGGDNLGLGVIKAMTFVSHDWALVANAFWLLTFPLVAGITYLVVRRLGLGRFGSLVTASLFSLLPYHFIPGEAHLLQSGYWAVPLGALLVLDVLRQDGDEPLVGPASPRRRWVVSLALCAVIASSGPYYAFFTIALLAVAGGFALLSRATRANALRAAALAAAIIAVATLNNLSSLLYHHSHGTNPNVATRSLGESDVYGLNISQLLLPVADHRLAPLAHLSSNMAKIKAVSGLPGAPNTPLGLAAAAGLVLSVGWCLVLALRAERGATLRGPPLLARLGLLSIACILLAVTTGLSTIVGVAGVLQIRVWARMAIFIAFFSLVALGIVVTLVADRARARLSASGATRWASPIVAGAIAVLACLAVADQTTPAMIPRYRVIRTQVASDREFVQGIENVLPAGSAVFQLPIVSFPERPPVVLMTDYDQFRPYLQSHQLRWSYGAMRGRPADWSAALGGAPLETFLDRVVDAGFSGVYVNRDGFADRGATLEEGLAKRLGPPAVVSREGRQSFYDLRPWATRERASLTPADQADRRRQVLHPVGIHPGSGAYPVELTPPQAGYAGLLYTPALPGQSSGWWAGATTSVELVNPLPGDRRVTVAFGAAAVPGATGTLEADAGSAHLSIPLAGDAVPVRLETVLPPGASTLRFVSTVPTPPLPDGRSVSFRITDLRIDDAR